VGSGGNTRERRQRWRTRSGGRSGGAGEDLGKGHVVSASEHPDVGADGSEGGEGLLEKVHVGDGGDALKVGDVDEESTTAGIKTKVDGSDAARGYLVRLDLDEAVAEQHFEAAKVHGGGSSSSFDDGDGRRSPTKRVEVVMTLHGGEHEERPKRSLEVISLHGRAWRALLKEARPSIVQPKDWSRAPRARRRCGGVSSRRPKIHVLGGELRPIVCVPLVDDPTLTGVRA
jgi:hypothetical protein